MAITVKAVYKSGVLKPLEPLALPENQVVSMELTPLEPPVTLPPSDFASLYGVWSGLAEALDAALEDGRQTTNTKLQRLIRESGEPPR